MSKVRVTNIKTKIRDATQCRFSGIHVQYINAIRRAYMSLIPAVSFAPNDEELTKIEVNTSPFDNEYVRDNIAQIPVTYTLNEEVVTRYNELTGVRDIYFLNPIQLGEFQINVSNAKTRNKTSILDVDTSMLKGNLAKRIAVDKVTGEPGVFCRIKAGGAFRARLRLDVGNVKTKLAAYSVTVSPGM